MRLKMDLARIYNAEVFPDKFIKDMLDFIFENELNHTFFLKLVLQLILTFMATTAYVERSFPAWKRIKTTPENRMTNEKISSFAFISIKKEKINKLKQTPLIIFMK